MGAGNGACIPFDTARIRPFAGRPVKAVFTICSDGRYACGMVIIVSLALATAALAVPLERVEPHAVAPERQAQATVTILPAVRLHFSEIERDQPERLRETVIRAVDGSTQRAKLVEFQ